MESPMDYFRRWKCHVTIRLYQFESLGNSVGKIVWHHHAVAYFQTNCIPRRRNRRYIPTDLETKLFPSVIPLVFSGFLVVSWAALWQASTVCQSSTDSLIFFGFNLNLLLVYSWYLVGGCYLDWQIQNFQFGLLSKGLGFLSSKCII
jgi:hypothetical protein